MYIVCSVEESVFVRERERESFGLLKVLSKPCVINFHSSLAAAAAGSVSKCVFLDKQQRQKTHISGTDCTHKTIGCACSSSSIQ